MFLFIYKKQYTVEYGYNDHGYNEFTPVRNKICLNIQSQVVTLLHKPSRL
jgi:hypothetical protein